MKILCLWDNDAEAELLQLYLGREDELHVVSEAESFTTAVDELGWGAVLMTTSFPDDAVAFELFTHVRNTMRECPIIGAAHTEEVFRLAQFLRNGMRAYLIRDKNGDFMFLAQAAIENAVAAMQAEREQFIAEKLREEVESVRKLQESIIPQDLKCPHGFGVVARYESSQIRVLGGQPVTLAGGDSYDVFMLDDHNMVILVGDASGHGMKACMSIMTMHTLVSMIRTRQFKDTASFVEEVNHRLCSQSVVQEEGGFITLCYGILNGETREFTWTSAGHPFPIVHNLDSNEVYSLGNEDNGGLPLAIISDAEYDMITSKLPPRCRLLVYTDGLEEAFADETATHIEFGISGIMKTMKRSGDKNLEDSMQALFDDSNAFTQGIGRHDDTSIVLIENGIRKPAVD